MHQFMMVMCEDASFLAITWDGTMYRVRDLLVSMSQYCDMEESQR